MLWTIDNLTGSGVFTKTGTGVLDITGIANNAFTGSYQINAGAVLGLGALTNNIALNGGVYAGQGTFNRSLGTGDNQVQWVAGTLGGGFAATGGNLTVGLTGGPDPLVWGGTPSFVPNGAPLIFGATAATDVVDFTNNIDLNTGPRTVTVVDNTAVTTDKAVLSGVLSNGAITKTGNGILQLSGANTFSAVTVTQGTLQFSTVSNMDGGPSNLGAGTATITLSGGTLSFIGDGAANSQSTDRVITATVGSNLNASGTNGATITYAGGISAATLSMTLSGSATGQGFITGGFTQTSTGPDLTVASGNWTFSGTPVVVGDDFKINGVGTVLNLNSPNVLGYFPGTSNFVYIGNGGTVNLGADGVASADTGLEGILVGYETAGAATTFNTNTYNISTPRLDLGQLGVDVEGQVLGSGTITVTGPTAGSGISLIKGLVTANLAGPGAIYKASIGDVILSGNNSGLTGEASRVDAGNLILDYRTSNTDKLNALSALDMRGSTLTLIGHDTEATTQSFVSLTLANGGANKISVVSGAGPATLNLGDITRANGTGTLQLVSPASGGIFTTTGNHATTGLLGTTGTAFATVTDASGTNFAAVDGTGKIVSVATVTKNDVATWADGDHVTDSAGGFTGIAALETTINSLRFNAAGPSMVTLAPRGILNIASGGILQTSNVTDGVSGITGGAIFATSGELVVTTDGATEALQISSSISGTQALTKNGAGVLHLSGNNYYSGTTLLQNGTLRLSGGNAIGDRSLVVFADDHSSILELLNDESVGSLSGGSATATMNTLAVINMGSNNLTLNNTATQVYLGLITGNGTLIKNGASSQELEGNSTGFTGKVIINQGLLHLDAGAGALSGATSFTLNGSTASLLSDQDGDSDINRIGNTATITLNNTAGSYGLRIRNSNDEGEIRIETVGTVTIGGGHNVITVEQANSAANTTARLTSAALYRSNMSTLLVRGHNLGAASGNRGLAVFTLAPAGAVGGGGAAGSTNLNIYPYIIGDANTSSNGLGDTFVTNTTLGLRALNLTTEYVLNEAGYNGLAATGTDNVRFYVSPDNVLSAGNKTINSLVLDSTFMALNMRGTAGSTLTLTSGALLATTTTPGNATRISGFGGIQTGNGEYTFYTTNATHTLTIDSPLTTPWASLTKSGAGTLVLTNPANAFGGGLWFNQGVIESATLGGLGTGALNFYGGTLRWAAGSTYDISSRTTMFGVGGGTLDTNGNDVNLQASIGGGGEGGLTKVGNGMLTLNAPANYQGGTTVNAGTVRYGVANALPATTDVVLAGGGIDLGIFDTTLKSLTLAANGSFNVQSSLTIPGTLLNSAGNRTLTFTGTGTTTFDGTVQLSESASNRTLVMAVIEGVVVINGTIINGPSAASGLTKTGNGLLELTAANSYTGATTIGSSALVGGTLKLSGNGTLGAGALTVNNGTLIMGSTSQTVTTLTMGGGPAGASSLIEIGAGLVLKPSSIVFSASGNNNTAVIRGDGTLDLGDNGITVNVANSTLVDVDMSWEMNTVIGSGTFIKTGAGTLDIRGVTNFNYNA